MGSGVLLLPQLAAGTMAAVARLHGALHCAGAVCAPSRAACISAGCKEVLCVARPSQTWLILSTKKTTWHNRSSKYTSHIQILWLARTCLTALQSRLAGLPRHQLNPKSGSRVKTSDDFRGNIPRPGVNRWAL